MNTAALFSFGPIYNHPANVLAETAANGTIQSSFSQLLQNATASSQVQNTPVVQTSSNIMHFFEELGAALSIGALPAAQKALASLEQNLQGTLSSAATSGSSSLEPLPTVSEPQAVVPSPVSTTTTTDTITPAVQEEPKVVGTATGQSDWYQKVIQPLIDALPAEVRQTYQAAWDQAAEVQESVFAQSSGLPGPGVYMYGMTPGGSLIGDFVGNPALNQSQDLGNYIAGAGLFKGKDRATIAQGVLDTAAFNAANQAILNKYSYDLRAGDIRIGTGDNYTVYNPITGARAAINLTPPKATA